jgi:hypothetical protein
MNEAKLPSPQQVAEQIKSCRDELDALKRLYRACKAQHEASTAREVRSRPTQGGGAQS